MSPSALEFSISIHAAAKKSGPSLINRFLVMTICYSMAICATAQEAIGQPVTYSAQYQARANLFKASATRSLTVNDDGSYLLINDLQATLLGQTIARV